MLSFSNQQTRALKTDLSRLLMTHGAAQKLALAFHNVNTDRTKDVTKFLDSISEIFENFVLSDSDLRSLIASREVLKCMTGP